MASGTIKTNKTFIKTHLKQDLTFTADQAISLGSVSDLTDGRYSHYSQINHLQKIVSGGNTASDIRGTIYVSVVTSTVYYLPTTTQQNAYIYFAIGHIE